MFNGKTVFLNKSVGMEVIDVGCGWIVAHYFCKDRTKEDVENNENLGTKICVNFCGKSKWLSGGMASSFDTKLLQ